MVRRSVTCLSARRAGRSAEIMGQLDTSLNTHMRQHQRPPHPIRPSRHPSYSGLGRMCKCHDCQRGEGVMITGTSSTNAPLRGCLFGRGGTVWHLR